MKRCGDFTAPFFYYCTYAFYLPFDTVLASAFFRDQNASFLQKVKYRRCECSEEIFPILPEFK